MSHSTPGMASGSQVSTVQSRTQGSAGVSAEPLGQSIMTVVARNSAFVLGAQVAIKIMAFLFNVYIVRRLGAVHFGQYSAVMAYVIFRAYQSQSEKVIEFISKTAAALQEMTEAIRSLDRRVENLERKVLEPEARFSGDSPPRR